MISWNQHLFFLFLSFSLKFTTKNVTELRSGAFYTRKTSNFSSAVCQTQSGFSRNVGRKLRLKVYKFCPRTTSTKAMKRTFFQHHHMKKKQKITIISMFLWKPSNMFFLQFSGPSLATKTSYTFRGLRWKRSLGSRFPWHFSASKW